MKKRRKVLAIVFLLFLLGISIFLLWKTKKENENPIMQRATEEDTFVYMPNEILVNYKSDAYILEKVRQKLSGNETFLEAKEMLRKAIEAEIREKIGDKNATVSIDFLLRDKTKPLTIKQGGMILVNIKSTSKTTEDLQDIFVNDEDILQSNPNYIFHTRAENKNDLWNIYNNSFDAGVNADKAWESGYTGKGVTVAIVDTGINYTHPDLQANVWKNPGETLCDDGIDNDNNGYIDDCYGWNFGGTLLSGNCQQGNLKTGPENNNTNNGNLHGTHVAGIVGAVKNNTGVVGVAHEATLMPVKVFPGNVICAANDSIVKGVYYAIENGADIINISAGDMRRCDDTPLLKQAVQAAIDAGISVVAASGNSGPNEPNSPALCDGVLGVGATDVTKNLDVYSSYVDNMVDVVAPGTDIVSTVSGGGYMAESGTSMSTPHVSGVIALLLQKNPNLTPAEIETLVCDTAKDIGTPGRDKKSGCGLIDAALLLNAVKEKEKENNPPLQDLVDPPKIGELSDVPVEKDPINEGNTPVEKDPINEGNTPVEKDPINEGNTPVEKNPINEGNTPVEKDPINEGNTPQPEDKAPEKKDLTTEKGKKFTIDIPKQITYPGCPLAPVTVSGGTGKYNFAFGTTQNMGVIQECSENTCTFTPPIATGQGTLVVTSGGQSLFSVIFSQPNPTEDYSYEISNCLKQCKKDTECIQTCMPSPTNCPNNAPKKETPPKENPDNNILPKDPIYIENPPANDTGNQNPIDNINIPLLQDPEKIPELTKKDVQGPADGPPAFPIAQSLKYRSCTEDITQHFQTQKDWNETYLLHGDTQNTWQRAILSYPQGFLELGNTKKSSIRGSAEPNSRVQIFFFSPKKNKQGNLLPPAQGTCIETTSDKNGYFSLEASPNIFWENLGEDIIFDAFFLKNTQWDLFSEKQKNTVAPLPAQTVKVGGVSPNENCNAFCENGVTMAVKISSDLFPASLAQQNNLQEGESIVITRGPGKQSFSVLTENSFSSVTTAQKQFFFYKALVAEEIKRNLTEKNLSFLHDIVTASKNREKNIIAFIEAWKKEEKNKTLFSLPLEKILDEIFPKNVAEKTWKPELLEALSLWSGGRGENTCFLPKNENTREYFTQKIKENPCT